METARELPQMKIRLPVEVKSLIENQAQQNFRSLNSEIVSRLVESLRRDAQTKNAPAVDAAEAPI
ncbi:Arc family DNA-binding protein [Massilia oculi]|uniref:Arc family DNA-binding protein n=1 Tax=Massilia oculi TaxID=945844 RepID=UPI001AAFF027|nr:Arc family DNA-binding protein [Massilia oculi]